MRFKLLSQGEHLNLLIHTTQNDSLCFNLVSVITRIIPTTEKAAFYSLSTFVMLREPFGERIVNADLIIARIVTLIGAG